MNVPSNLLSPAKLLVVDDDVATRVLCLAVLKRAGYRVVEAADGLEALEIVEREKPALIVLDLDMPRLGGLETVRTLRVRGNRTPVLMLTGFNGIDQRVKGLGAGADDYLGKPFNDRELVARIGALLRRSHSVERVERLHFDGTTVDLQARTAVRAGGQVSLTKKEYAILELLARAAGRPVAREKILDAVWGYGAEANTRTLDTHIWRLRRKLGDNGDEPRWLRNVPGVGYTLRPDAGPSGAAR